MSKNQILQQAGTAVLAQAKRILHKLFCLCYVNPSLNSSSDPPTAIFAVGVFHQNNRFFFY